MSTLLVWLLAGLAGLAAPGSPPPAATFRADPAHGGVYATDAGPALRGAQWKFQTRGPVRGSPTISGDAVFVGSGDGSLYALSLVTGHEKWRADLGGAVHSAPAVSGDLVVATSRERRVTALDRETGRVRWRFEAGPDAPFPWGWDFWLSSPVVAAGIVYVGSGDGNLYALEATSGRKVWQASTGGRVRSSPAVRDGVVYVGSMDGRLYALDAATGKSRWAFDTEGRTIDSQKAGYDRTSIVSSPAVTEGEVFVGSRDAHLYAVDRQTGRQRWRFGHRVDRMEGSPEVSWVIGSPAVFDGLVYVGSSDGRFFDAVRIQSGEEVWRFKTPGNVLSSAALAGGQVFFGCEDGHVFALDEQTGVERWRFRTGGAVMSSPAVAGGVVVVGSDDGVVYALRTGAERPGTRTRRAVYWRDSGPRRWFQGETAVRDYFREEGYEVLDEAGLTRFLADTAAAPRAVVVMASGQMPPGVLAPAADQSLFRRYLAAGGRMVWLGLPPDSVEIDPKTGNPVGFDLSRSTRLLGVAHEGSGPEAMGAAATAEGRAWGMPDWWLGGFPVAPGEVTQVLGLNELGLASAWIKSYGGPAGSGFVRVWGQESPIPELAWVQAVAEHVE